jgi:lysophospholipase L1-like esterase
MTIVTRRILVLSTILLVAMSLDHACAQRVFGRESAAQPMARKDGVQPKVVVLLAGTNNLGTSSAHDAQVADISGGIKALLEAIRTKAPQATIIVMGIFPRNDRVRPTAVIPMINKINDNIAKLANGKTIRYLNINDKLADKDGTLFEGMTVDRLHLSLKGYQIWADALKPLLTELLGPRGRVDHAPPPTGDPSATKERYSTCGGDARADQN